MNYQWDQPYQAIPDPRMPIMLQTWHQERGCPLPRPRSYSLNALASSNSTISFTGVSNNKLWNKNTSSILPLANKSHYSGSSQHRSTNKRCRTHFCYLTSVLAATCLILVGLAVLRTRYLKRNAAILEHVTSFKVPNPDHRTVYSPTKSAQQPPASSFNHHPSPQHSFANSPVYYNQPQTRQLPYQQNVQQSPQQMQYHPERFAYHYGAQYGHSYAHAPVMYNNVQQPKLQPYKNPQRQAQDNRNGFSWVDPNDIKHHGAAPVRKPWMLEHADDRREHHRHQTTPKTNKFDQQSTTQTSPKSNLDRQQDRAKVRNEARNSQSKSSTRNVGDIWEEERASSNVNKKSAENEMDVKLILEPAVSPHREYVNADDGTILIKSFEDDEDVTIEIVLEE